MIGADTNPFATASVWIGVAAILTSMVRAFQDPGWISTGLFYLILLLAIASAVWGLVGMRRSEALNGLGSKSSLVGLAMGGTIILSNYVRWVWTLVVGIFR
jgi:hypothetical protein